jgi:hypothetical protein
MTITIVQTTPEFLGVLNFFLPFFRVKVSSLLDLKSSITLLLDHLSTLSSLTKIISNGEDLTSEILLQFPLFLGEKKKNSDCGCLIYLHLKESINATYIIKRKIGSPNNTD